MADLPERGTPEPPRQRGEMAVRVADADRDRTVTMLREHMIEGRITLDEFSERAGLALEARTQGDLASVMADLPVVAPPGVESRRPVRRKFVGVMSEAGAKGRWRVGEQTTAVAVMGECVIDLRHAEIDAPEIVIKAVAFWGEVKVIVPEGIDVQLEGFSFMGGRSMKLRRVPIVPGSPRIRVRGYSIMGGINIRSRSNRNRRELAQSVVDNVLSSIAGTGAPGQSGGAAEPIDLVALGRDIRDQIRAQHRSARSVTPRRAPAGRPQAEAPEPLTSTQPSEGTVTILFSDMVNYAGMTEALGDQASRELLQEHHRIVRKLVQQHGGREVKVQGDGFMMAFGGAARALRCAAELQQTFGEYSAAHPDRPIRIHIGVHTGEVFEEDDDFLGHAVIVASRLADSAGPGEIIVSSMSEQLVARSEEFRFGPTREVPLKGLTRPQPAATLLWDMPAAKG